MTTPLCRIRILYLGCAVPKSTKEGLQAIQDPLQEIYPDGGADDVTGIDGYISIWSNGILLEYPDSSGLIITKFSPIETLHYCAAVRYVPVTLIDSATPTSELVTTRFFPLDSPHAASSNHHHPPLFTYIIRRTVGIKVLECHGFICKNAESANALVRACFHSYSDSMQIRLYDFVPHPVAVVIPKTKSIFKLGKSRKKSRSKSVGPSSSRSSSIIMTPSPTPYIYDMRSPTPQRPIMLRTAAAPPQMRQQVLQASDYRYVSDLPDPRSHHNHSKHDRGSRAAPVWSGSGRSSQMDNYSVISNPSSLQQSRPLAYRAFSRQSQQSNSGEYADVASLHRRMQISQDEENYQQPMTYPEKEQFYEVTTVERRKGNQRDRSKPDNNLMVEEEFVEYHKQPEPKRRSASTGNVVMRKRYDSMPELSHTAVRVDQEPVELERSMRRMDLRGSAGSTGTSTPNSTPTTSSMGHFGERNGGRKLPVIPQADYHF